MVDQQVELAPRGGLHRGLEAVPAEAILLRAAVDAVEGVPLVALGAGHLEAREQGHVDAPDVVALNQADVLVAQRPELLTVELVEQGQVLHLLQRQHVSLELPQRQAELLDLGDYGAGAGQLVLVLWIVVRVEEVLHVEGGQRELDGRPHRDVPLAPVVFGGHGAVTSRPIHWRHAGLFVAERTVIGAAEQKKQGQVEDKQ